MTTPTQPLTMSKISFTEKFPKGYAAESLIGQCEIEANKQMQLIIASLNHQQEQDAIGFHAWMESSQTAADFWKQNRLKFEPKMDGSEKPKIAAAYKDLYAHYLREKQKGENTNG